MFYLFSLKIRRGEAEVLIFVILDKMLPCEISLLSISFLEKTNETFHLINATNLRKAYQTLGSNS